MNRDLKNALNKTRLQKVLEMVNYLRDFSEIISPLKELFKKDKICAYDKTHLTVLKELKNIICNASSLIHFDTNEKVETHCDASQFAIGCCLLQNKKPL